MEKPVDFRLLVIDDNPSIHSDFIKILTSIHTSQKLDNLSQVLFQKKSEPESALPNFTIDTASQGQEGLEKIKGALLENKPYSLAFVDIRMPPGWDGIETIQHIWEVDKDVQVVICTAFSDYSWEETVNILGKSDNLLILKKPFDNVTVRQIACALTKKWELMQDTRKFTNNLQKEIQDRTSSLQHSLSLIKATLESSDEGIVVINNEGMITEYNQIFCKMWNIPEAKIQNQDEMKLYEYMLGQLDNPQVYSDWLNAVTKDNLSSSQIDAIKFKDGRVFDCYSHPQKMKHSVIGKVLNFRDITERAKLENELQRQARYDALTGLPNRALLIERIQDAIKQSANRNTMFAVMFLDLDRFKIINDSLNHAAGDELLRLTAVRFLGKMRNEDTLARLGGDEFVIVLTNMKSLDSIKNKAKTFLELFQLPFPIENREITVTASIGISVYPEDGTTVEVLLRNADAAMYQVKDSGCNNTQFYTAELNKKSLEKLDREIELRQALSNEEFFLHYQPQLDLNNDRIMAAEALLRWYHPKRGVLMPKDFLQLAEETGLIIPIGEWVIRTVCQQNMKWQKAGFNPIRIAINIAVEQLRQPEFVNNVKMILEETQIPAYLLEFEITENIIVNSLDVIHTINALKKLGISIAIDDFGTGYSSLSYLKNLPLDRLKIDGSFINHIKSVQDDEAIIRAIISVARNLNLEVLAEGVETQNQINFLKKQDCHEIQGYYYSKPLSTDEMTKLFKSNTKSLELEK